MQPAPSLAASIHSNIYLGEIDLRLPLAVYVFSIYSYATGVDAIIAVWDFSMRKIQALLCKWSPHTVRT
jgi:hypothetical protein